MRVRAPAQRLRRSLMILGLIALAFIVLGTTLTYSSSGPQRRKGKARSWKPSHRDVLWSDRIQRGRQRGGRPFSPSMEPVEDGIRACSSALSLAKASESSPHRGLAISTRSTPTIQSAVRAQADAYACLLDSLGIESVSVMPSLRAGLQRCNSPSDIPHRMTKA